MCITKSAKLTRTWGKIMARQKRKEEFDLKNLLAKAHLDLQEDPQNKLLQANLADCTKKLTALDMEQAEWVSSTIQANWLIKGDRSTKLFLGQHKFKAKSKETYIK
jgi:hypothetical protein